MKSYLFDDCPSVLKLSSVPIYPLKLFGLVQAYSAMGMAFAKMTKRC